MTAYCLYAVTHYYANPNIKWIKWLLCFVANISLFGYLSVSPEPPATRSTLTTVYVLLIITIVHIVRMCSGGDYYERGCSKPLCNDRDCFPRPEEKCTRVLDANPDNTVHRIRCDCHTDLCNGKRGWTTATLLQHSSGPSNLSERSPSLDPDTSSVGAVIITDVAVLFISVIIAQPL